MTETRLYQGVAARIQAMIESGEYPPGSRLPGERDLAERLGVTRVTIREAEIALEARGWISIRTGSGVYVLERQSEDDRALRSVSAFDLTAARAVIEGEAAALAAAHISDDDLAELEELIVAMSDPSAGDEASVAADRRFHLTIARIAGNPVVEHMVTLIWRIRSEAPQVREVYAKVCQHDWSDRSEEHSAVLLALRSRNPAAARQAMHDHFRHLFEAMLQKTEAEALAEVRRRTEQNRERFLLTARA